MEKNPEKFVALERSTGGSFEHKQQETILFFFTNTKDGKNSTMTIILMHCVQETYTQLSSLNHE
jgi:hypothetical protein